MTISKKYARIAGALVAVSGLGIGSAAVLASGAGASTPVASCTITATHLTPSGTNGLAAQVWGSCLATGAEPGKVWTVAITDESNYKVLTENMNVTTGNYSAVVDSNVFNSTNLGDTFEAIVSEIDYDAVNTSSATFRVATG